MAPKAPPHVFVSYASVDLEIARSLAEALRRRRLRVWWDRDIPPASMYEEVIEAALNSARVVVVLWTEHSVKSKWVRDEAQVAVERQVMIPFAIGNVRPPLGFRQEQTISLQPVDLRLESALGKAALRAIRQVISSGAVPDVSQAATIPPYSPPPRPRPEGYIYAHAPPGQMRIKIPNSVWIDVESGAPVVQHADGKPGTPRPLPKFTVQDNRSEFRRTWEPIYGVANKLDALLYSPRGMRQVFKIVPKWTTVDVVAFDRWMRQNGYWAEESAK